MTHCLPSDDTRILISVKPSFILLILKPCRTLVGQNPKFTYLSWNFLSIWISLMLIFNQRHGPTL